MPPQPIETLTIEPSANVDLTLAQLVAFSIVLEIRLAPVGATRMATSPRQQADEAEVVSAGRARHVIAGIAQLNDLGALWTLLDAAVLAVWWELGSAGGSADVAIEVLVLA